MTCVTQNRIFIWLADQSLIGAGPPRRRDSECLDLDMPLSFADTQIDGNEKSELETLFAILTLGGAL